MSKKPKKKKPSKAAQKSKAPSLRKLIEDICAAVDRLAVRIQMVEIAIETLTAAQKSSPPKNPWGPASPLLPPYGPYVPPYSPPPSDPSAPSPDPWLPPVQPTPDWPKDFEPRWTHRSEYHPVELNERALEPIYVRRCDHRPTAVVPDGWAEVSAHSSAWSQPSSSGAPELKRANDEKSASE
jgi:hypothetical protein